MTRPDATEDPYRITVVCLGNICRSPIAEAVLRARLAEAGLADTVVVDSAGTGDWNLGQPADRRARAVLGAHGYALDHISRQIAPHWFDDIDLVVAMDESNYADLRRMMPPDPDGPRLAMMRSFDPSLAHLPEPHPDLDVPDPYYGGPEGFDEVLLMIEKAADGIVDGLLTGQLGR